MSSSEWGKALDYHSMKIIKIAIPVVITLIIDACLVRFLEEAHGSVSLDRSLSETMSYSQQGIDTKWSIYLALILIGAILIVTAVLLGLYYFGCMKVIYVWMIVAVSLLLSYYVILCLGDVPRILNIPMDYISLVLFLLNLVVVGNMVVFWRGPQIVTQVFLIFISVLIAIVFLTLPDWTVWILLGLLVIYDACVVLCPHGLLNLLIKKSEERGDAIPALVYSSAAWNTTLDGTEEEENDQTEGEGEENGEEESDGELRSVSDVQTAPRQLLESPLIEEAATPQEALHEMGTTNETHKKKRKKHDNDEEDGGVRLGLGDFCFYGILVTRAARLGWDLTILCVFAVILGLGLTLLILALLQRPLPALPFSLILGVIFFIIGALTFRPFGLSLRELSLVF